MALSIVLSVQQAITQLSLFVLMIGSRYFQLDESCGVLLRDSLLIGIDNNSA